MTGEELMDELGMIDYYSKKAILLYQTQMWILSVLYIGAVLISMINIPLSILFGLVITFSFWYVTKKHKKEDSDNHNQKQISMF